MTGEHPPASSDPPARSGGPTRRLVVMDEARFACQGSGTCCSGYTYGPVEPAVVSAVRGHRFRENAAAIGAADPFPQVPRPGARGAGSDSMHVLRTVGARCVFLSQADECVIHKELGPEAKPAICRAYPLLFTEVPDGAWHVSLNMECGGFAEARRAGPSLRDQLPALEAIARAVPSVARLPDPIPLTSGRSVTAARFLALDSAWLAGLRQRQEPIAGHLRHLARQLNAFAEAYAGASSSDDTPPLTSGSEHRDGTELLTAGVRGPLLAAAEALLPALLAWTHDEREAGNLLQAQLCTRVAVATGLLLGQSIGPDRTLLARALALAGQPLASRFDEGAHGVLLDHLKNVVFGKHLPLAGPLFAALGAETLRLAIAAALAQVIAAMSRAPHVTDVHANEGLRVVNRLLRPSLVLSAFAEAPQALEAITAALSRDCMA